MPLQQQTFQLLHDRKLADVQTTSTLILQGMSQMLNQLHSDYILTYSRVSKNRQTINNNNKTPKTTTKTQHLSFLLAISVVIYISEAEVDGRHGSKIMVNRKFCLLLLFVCFVFVFVLFCFCFVFF